MIGEFNNLNRVTFGDTLYPLIEKIFEAMLPMFHYVLEPQDSYNVIFKIQVHRSHDYNKLRLARF